MKKILLVAISAIFLSGCNRLDNHQPLQSSKLTFTKSSRIGQTFSSHRDNLNMVYICVRNSGRSLIPLRFELKSDEGKVLRTLDFTGGNIDNDDCTRFQFEPVADSKNKTYEADIVAQLDSKLEPAEVALLRNGVYIESHGGGDYKDGVAMVDGQPTQLDLHFKTLYSQPLKDVIKEAWQGLIARLTMDPIFMSIYLSLLIFLILKLKRAN